MKFDDNYYRKAYKSCILFTYKVIIDRIEYRCGNC